MKRQRAVVCAALALAACGAPPRTSERGENLYGLGSIGGKWPGGNVPVCYTTPSDHPELQAKIPGILASEWSRAANLHFTGFGACSGGNEVEITFVSGTNGVTDNLGVGTREMNLISDDTPDLTHFTYEVVHEFGHALGFAHEMKRPDNWVGGVALQCPPGAADGSTDVTQFSAEPGGVDLTPNYDPNSIMNYCAGTTGIVFKDFLSVGDILAVSSAAGYGPSQCTFPNAITTCTSRPQLQYDSEWTIPAGCLPALGGWVLKQVGGGNVPAAPEANTFLLGHQAEGAVTSGPAIGSFTQFQMCDTFGNCSAPFSIQITGCNTRLDDFYVAYSDTLYVTQGGNNMEELELAGPWVNDDAGIGAVGKMVSTSLPNPTASTFAFGAGYSNNTGCGTVTDCVAFIDMTVSIPYSTPVGTYTATVQATDPVTQVTRKTVTPIVVEACTPPPSSCSGLQCGTYEGCGETLNCGTCGGTNVCSAGHCCASGDVWNGSACGPPPPPACNCRPGFYCAANGACERVGNCKGTTCM